MPFFPSRTGGAPAAKKPRGLVTAIQAGSLLATGWLVWSASLIPQVRRQTLPSLLAEVLGYTVVAWAWSAVVTMGLYAMVPAEERSEMRPDVLRTAATAVWFGPAMILLSEFSPAALLAALVLVVYASRLLYTQWRPLLQSGGPPVVYTPREPGEFKDCQLPRQFVWRERLPAICVALCLEAGVVAVALHFPLLGAAWLCMGTALLTVFSMSTGAADAGRPPSLPRSIIGIMATILLAVMLTLGGGSGDRAGQQRTSLVETARAVLRQVFYGETPRVAGENPPGGTPRAVPGSAPATGAFGGYPGVILWPEIKPMTALVAPMPAGQSLIPGRPAAPYSIPFAGEYWMFRWPFARPPASSYLTRGTPTAMAFSSTDQTALQMEAHHKLDTPVDIRCCRGIDVDLANADSFPGTLSIELVLLDTDSGHSGSQRIGMLPVTSHPDLQQTPVRPVAETLEFKMPAQPTIEQFNEFKIVFQRARLRMDKSARVSIERFVLLPR